MAQTPSDAGSGTNATTLARGKACLRCRKRKMRCDGTKPACSQCLRAHKPDACQYDDGKGKTRTQALREKIARLEEEIAQLRDPESSSTPSIVLHDPHATQSASPSQHSLSQFTSSSHHRHTRSHSHIDSGGSSSSSPVGSPSTGSPGLSAASPYSSFDSVNSPPTPYAPLRTLSPALLIANDDPPVEILQPLYDLHSKSTLSAHLPSPLSFDSRLEVFLVHRHQCGFALHTGRFRTSFTGMQGLTPQQYSAQQVQYQRHPVLASAALLWASFLSHSTQLGVYEQQYLKRTQKLLVDALNITQYCRQSQSQSQSILGQGGLSPSMTPSPVTSVSPATVAVDAIQASVLLARYFFAIGRLHEASYHASAAADLAVQVGLHQISSSYALAISQEQRWVNFPSINPVSSSELHLAPPQDSIELGERIGVFWQVYILDRLLSVALRRPPCIVDDDCVETRIDTPWPDDIEEYENMSMDAIQGNNTLRIFFLHQGQPTSTSGGFSHLALRVKAAALYSAAVRASANWGFRPSAQLQSSSPPSNPLQELQALELTITRFLTTLLPIHQLSAGLPDEDRRSNLMVYTLAYAALVQLHLRFAREGDLQSLDKCLRAAYGAVQLIKHFTASDFDFLDPVFGPCWTTLSDVFSLGQISNSSTWSPQVETRMQQALNVLLTALSRLSARFPAIGLQFSMS